MVRVCCSLFLIHGNFSVDRKDLPAFTLVGPIGENLVLDPLAVQHLNNWLYYSSNKWVYSRCISDHVLSSQVGIRSTSCLRSESTVWETDALANQATTAGLRHPIMIFFGLFGWLQDDKAKSKSFLNYLLLLHL